jgi:hypothetical protein
MSVSSISAAQAAIPRPPVAKLQPAPVQVSGGNDGDADDFGGASSALVNIKA